jgi:cyclohexa-1,5-dienecarbonyl-CoA hydratase
VGAARTAFAELARARLAEAEESYLNDLMGTRDANEGLAAFLAKRRPAWEHR